VNNVAEQNNTYNGKDFNLIWKRPVNKIGIITLVCAMAASLLPNIYLYIAHGAFPPISVVMKAWSMILVAYVGFYFIEPFSYYPILGLTGTYMSFLTGNISNLRLPASAVAQEAVGVEPGSKEAELVSTLAISGSVITNTLFVTLAAIIGTTIIEAFPQPVIAGLTQFTLPAIFGAIFAQFAMSNIKIAILALPVPLIMLGLLHTTLLWLVIICSVFGAIGFSRLGYKAGKL